MEKGRPDDICRRMGDVEFGDGLTVDESPNGIVKAIKGFIEDIITVFSTKGKVANNTCMGRKNK